MDRILVVSLPVLSVNRVNVDHGQTMRKASTAYYPTLHLELARYVELLRTASPSGKLPHLIDKMVGSPPEHLRRFDDPAFGGL